MPKRKRRDSQPTRSDSPSAGPDLTAKPDGPVAASPVAIDPAVALFAQRHQESIERDKARQRDAAAARREAGELDRLRAAKDEAVAAMKRAARGSAADRAAAETAYRSATADLIARETGERPAWAPAVAPLEEDVEVSGEGTGDTEGTTDTEAEGASDIDAEGAPAGGEDKKTGVAEPEGSAEA